MTSRGSELLPPEARRALTTEGPLPAGERLVRFAEGLARRIVSGDVPEILERTVLKGETVDRLLYTDTKKKTHEREADVPFYRKQDRRILSQNKLVDPTSIDDYIAIGGYSALVEVLRRSPEDVIEEVVGEPAVEEGVEKA